MKKVYIIMFLITLLIFPSFVHAETDSEKLIGLIQVWGSTTDKVPSGYLLADGRAVSRTTYKKLFDKIGTKYGSGDGSTTFNLPNMKGRTAVGLSTADSDFSSVGKSGGTKSVTLTVDQMPSHTHTQNAHNHTQEAHNHIQEAHNHIQKAHTHIQSAHNHSQNAHNHSQSAHTHTGNGWNFSLFKGTHSNEDVGGISGSGYAMTQVKASGGYWTGAGATAAATATNVAATATNIAATATNQNTTAVNNETVAINNETTAVNRETTATNQNTGGGKAHNNLQPYIVMNYIIKYE